QFLPSTDEHAFVKGFKVKLVSGHTEAMRLPFLEYKNKHILSCADLSPSVAHLSITWVKAYDTRPLLTLQEKESIIPMAAKNDWLLFFEHDYKNEMTSLSLTEKGIRSKEFLKITDL